MKQSTTLMNINVPTLVTPYLISHYSLPNEEYTALSFGLDHHIPTKSKDVAIEVELEQFYQGLFIEKLNTYTGQLVSSLKTKLRSICEKYSNINIQYKYKKVVDNLSNNKNIMILKQDKERDLVILVRTKYSENCMALLNTERFKKPFNSMEMRNAADISFKSLQSVFQLAKR